MPSDSAARSEPCLIVIFGASGDLTQRKLVPALYDLDRRGSLAPETAIVGVSRTEMSDEEFAARFDEIAGEAADFDRKSWNEFRRRLKYVPADATEEEGFRKLAERLGELAEERKVCRSSGDANVLFYLSVSPSLYEPIIARIGGSGLITEGKRWCSIDPSGRAWQRIIVEKPFGYDLESASALNRALGRVFEEESIFRIDHYLGKELVQNILVMRFANVIFEPVWNHRYVDHVQVTAAETVGVGSRAANYYDTSGALRDMVQSHLLQVLALVAMEPPSIYDAGAIMREKIKLFSSAAPITCTEAERCAAFGRYGAGEGHKAYVDEKGVDAARATETYAAMRVRFDNWRWAGVPFYLRSGKLMARKLTEVVVQFREPPTNLFRSLDTPGTRRPGNRIVMTIAPREGISVRIEGKRPGSGLRIRSANLDLDYAEAFGGEPQEAYGPLILDALRGDRTLFKHRDEVESSWAMCQPLLECQALRDGIQTYEPGSWGPANADELLARDGRAWHNPPEQGD